MFRYSYLRLVLNDSLQIISRSQGRGSSGSSPKTESEEFFLTGGKIKTDCDNYVLLVSEKKTNHRTFAKIFVGKK